MSRGSVQVGLDEEHAGRVGIEHEGEEVGARGLGKTREDTVRTEMRGGPMRATNASPTSPGVETLGMLPRMTHGDDGGGEVGDAMCGWSWSRSRKQNKRRRAMKKTAHWGVVV
jgi:hypothetical protein